MTTMQPATPRTRAAQRNRPTAYEVEIDGVPVAYTARRTKSGLLAIATQHGEAIVRTIEANGGDDTVSYTERDGWRFGPVCVRFTGRTEREAATEGDRE